MSRMKHTIGVGAGSLAVCIVTIALACQAAFAIPASPHPFTVTQPDGAAITLHIRGDEWFHWLEDQGGFTVIEVQGEYRYATLDRQDNLIATKFVVGRDDPKRAGLKVKTLPSSSTIRQIRADTMQLPAVEGGGVASAPSVVGTVKNLVISMRFSNHLARTLPSTADIDKLFNHVGPPHSSQAPTGSVRHVYFENSYGQFSLDSTVAAWVDLPNTEQFYSGGNSGLTTTIWSAITTALNLADASVDFSQFDQDNDGWIDAITFLHSGYGAEFGGTDSDGTTSAFRIWSHRWFIPTWTSAEGVKVSGYHISPSLWSTSGSDIGRIGVICHETGHFFGLPDLYDTNGGGSGIGSYGMMANSWGFTNDQLNPPHFSPWSKIALGWTTPTVITPGVYVALQAETNASVFRIDMGYPSGEYLLIENRQPVGVESTMPQGGLVVWHIDDTKCCNTDQGWPGQPGWPGNNKHYRVAVLQADGNYTLEKGGNRGDGGDVYRGSGVSSITDNTVPNLRSYQFGANTPTGNAIFSIGAPGPTMSFTYSQPPLDAPLDDVPGDSKGRYLTVMPTNPGTTTALRVILSDLPSPFDTLNNEAMWIGPPTPISESPGDQGATPSPAFQGANLQCTQECRDWTLLGGPIHVFGEAIVPGGRYEIQAIDCNDDPGVLANYSLALSKIMARWGDIVGPKVGTWPLPDTIPDFWDIQAAVEKFKALAGAPSKTIVDIAPAIPNRLVDFDDIQRLIEAFKNEPYPFTTSVPAGCSP